MKNDIQRYFAAIGAGVDVLSLRARDRRIGRRWMTPRMNTTPMLVDVTRDGGDERFSVTHHSEADINLLDLDRPSRHLLLTIKSKIDPVKRTFLCGRDESHWFVAAIPETSPVRSVQDAWNALKPREVWASIRLHNLPQSQWNLRRTKAFVRQGEWFFIPSPTEDSRQHRILKREPLSRGFRSQMHWCEEMFRTGGQRVWVNHRYPRGLSDAEHARLPAKLKEMSWQQMQRDAQPFARGSVRHRDHATITLEGWHEVVMNTEAKTGAMRHVVFLD